MGLFNSSEPKEKKTVRSELSKNINNSITLAKEIGNGYISSGNQLKERRKKGYAVNENVSLEEFEKSFRNFRLQMSVYLISFLISLVVLPFVESKMFIIAVMIYLSLAYTIYIRDIHRCRMVIANWDLRHTPMPLTWKTFLDEVRKQPKFLTPFAK